LAELKEKKLEDFKHKFDTLISAFYDVKLIKKVEFSKINTVFVNLKEKKAKKENLKNIIDIFKQNSKLEPLFHQVKLDEKWDKILILDKKNENIGDLYDVKYKIFNYLNQKGKIIKSIYKPIDKKFIKKLDKKVYDEIIKVNKMELYVSDCAASASAIGIIFSSIFFPPVLPLCLVSLLVGVANIRNFKDLESIYENKSKNLNKEFNETKVIDELIIEEDNEFNN